MEITAYKLASRFNGIKEVSGNVANPQILSMLKLDSKWPEDDAVPWCSAFVNYIAWLLDLPRTKSLRARSWLLCGKEIALSDARIGFDVVVLSRGKNQPGPDVIEAQGHVGWYSGHDAYSVYVLGGNQNDSVSIANYSIGRILGIRRIHGN